MAGDFHLHRDLGNSSNSYRSGPKCFKFFKTNILHPVANAVEYIDSKSQSSVDVLEVSLAFSVDSHLAVKGVLPKTDQPSDSAIIF